MNHQVKINKYVDLIIKFNSSINLVSKKDLSNLVPRHIDDARLALLTALNSKRISFEYPFYDLGSGNGIPGFLWAILLPETKFILVDTDERKCEFLKTACARVGLSNLYVECKNLFSISPPADSLFICRGLMAIDQFISKDNPFASNRGLFIKGSTWNNEVVQTPLTSLSSFDYSLENGTKRSLVYYSPKCST